MTSNLLATVRKARLGLALLAAISIHLPSAPPAQAGTTITQSTCPVVIALPGEYDLATDVGPCLDDGIDITASGVTLHLNGHTITFASLCDFPVAGIHVGLPTPTPMLSRVRVLGPGTIRNFQFGFLAENSAGSFVKFVTVDNTQCSGGDNEGFVIIPPGGQWKLQGNVVRTGAGGGGVDLRVDDSDLVRNDVNGSIFLSNSSNTTVVNNTVNSLSTPGIELSLGSNNNEIHANTTNNGTEGIHIRVGSSANTITGNTSFNNGGFDMTDDNPNCDSNKWHGNHFGTANQPSCIH